MIPPEASLAFFGVSVLLAIAPGPDNLFVLVHSALYGWRAGMRVVLGLCTGLVAHTAAVAVGLAAVLAASERAYTALRLTGAAYLAYLAWRSFTAPVAPPAGATPPVRPSRLYARGIVMNVTNPKVAVFFLSFLPQFIDSSRGNVALQTLWLGLLFIGATLVTFGAIACFAASIGATLKRSPALQRALGRIAGVVLFGLAARLALDR